MLITAIKTNGQIMFSDEANTEVFKNRGYDDYFQCDVDIGGVSSESILFNHLTVDWKSRTLSYDAETHIKNDVLEQWANLRAERDTLLKESDWTQLPDAPVDSKAWDLYRQKLRDLPANTKDPLNIAWPAKPGG